MLEVTYTVRIEPCADGGYIAYFPALPGCQTRGESLEEVIATAKEALRNYMKSLLARGGVIPEEQAAAKIGFELPVSASLER